jgi:hypothetical protein
MSQNVPILEPLACEDEEQPWEWTEQRETAALLVAQDDLSDEKIAKKLKIDRRTLHRWKTVKEFRLRVDEHLDEIRKAILRFPVAKKIYRVERINRDWEELKKILRIRQKAAREQRVLHEECQATLRPLLPERDKIREQLGRLEKGKQHCLEPDEIAEAEETEAHERLLALDKKIGNLERTDPGPLHPGQETGLYIRVVTQMKYGEKIEWVLDTALLVALQRHEEQINKELADYIDKHDVSSGGKPIEATPPVIVLRGVSMDDL